MPLIALPSGHAAKRHRAGRRLGRRRAPLNRASAVPGPRQAGLEPLPGLGHRRPGPVVRSAVALPRDVALLAGPAG